MAKYFIVPKKILEKDNIGETDDLDSAKNTKDVINKNGNFLILQEV